jgi:hypothetical protein
MLWTVFMLVMFSWMLGLVLEFRLGAIPLVIVITTILAFIKVIRRSSFNWGAGLVSGSSNKRLKTRVLAGYWKWIGTKEKTRCLKSLWVMKFLVLPADTRHHGIGREPSSKPQSVPLTIFILWHFHVRNARDPLLPGGPGREKMT